MTGYTVHTGASKKFVAGWDNIFGDKKQESASKETDTKKSVGKKTKPKTGKK